MTSISDWYIEMFRLQERPQVNRGAEGASPENPGRNSQAKGLYLIEILESAQYLIGTPKGINPTAFKG